MHSPACSMADTEQNGHWMCDAAADEGDCCWNGDVVLCCIGLDDGGSTDLL